MGLAFFLNLSFTVVEFFGGILTNSTAILADALHDAGDSFSLGLAWYLDRYSKKPEDLSYSYGYARFSLLGAVITGLVLVGGSVAILAKAVPQLSNPEPTHAPGMIGLALLGITVNGVAALRMKSATGISARVVMWHLVEDILGWAAILAVALVLLFRDLYILDPILSIVITFYVLYSMSKNLRQAAVVFLQRTPSGVDMEAIKEKFLAIENVVDAHHVHAWSLDGEHHVLSAHVVVDRPPDPETFVRLKNDICRVVAGEDFVHSAVEIDFAGESCTMDEPEGHPAGSAPPSKKGV